MNEKQIELLTSILQAMNLALAAKIRIEQALKIGGLVCEKEAIQYVEDLQNFIDSATRIGWKTQFSFGGQSTSSLANDALQSDHDN